MNDPGAQHPGDPVPLGQRYLGADPIDWCGAAVYPMYTEALPAGTTALHLRALSVMPPPDVSGLGIGLSVQDGHVNLNGRSLAGVDIWSEALVDGIDISVTADAPDALFTLTPVWVAGTSEHQSWTGNYGVVVDLLPDGASTLWCSTGPGTPDFNELVVELTTGPAPAPVVPDPPTPATAPAPPAAPTHPAPHLSAVPPPHPLAAGPAQTEPHPPATQPARAAQPPSAAQPSLIGPDSSALPPPLVATTPVSAQASSATSMLPTSMPSAQTSAERQTMPAESTASSAPATPPAVALPARPNPRIASGPSAAQVSPAVVTPSATPTPLLASTPPAASTISLSSIPAREAVDRVGASDPSTSHTEESDLAMSAALVTAPLKPISPDADPAAQASADQAFSRALHDLGTAMYARGEQDSARALWTQAAEAGHSGAAYDLGMLLLAAGDRIAAEKWLKAAARDDARAAASLSELPRPS
ncbi:hypothetical protein ACFVVM_09865 [Nocardia sp. NPDC058176]|uniref:hypothetical protein n=1 Tax=Nocardia sp. NPDC058176 TaxID=3346368 RepID=UPI0036D93183